MPRIFLALVVAAVAACGGDDSSSDSADATDTAAVETPDATEPPPTTEPPTTEPPPTTEAPPETGAPIETDAPATEPPSDEADPAPFEPVDDGPYEVGVETITITDETRDRPLTVDVWFPLEPGTEGEPHQYTLIPGTYYESPTAVSASRADASTDGPFPLVVYSHGSGGVRYNHSDYTEALASHGYVVAAPDHTGNTGAERLAGGEADFVMVAVDRPADVQVVIDAMSTPGDPETQGWPKHIDADSVAVTGHSFGGFTTLATVSGYENAQGEVPADPRVDAIIPLAPAVGDGGSQSLLDDDDLARVDVPLLVMTGTNDQTTPIDPNVVRIWEEASSEPLYRADLVDAQHQTFTDLCAWSDSIPLLPDAPEAVVELIETMATEGCSPGDMPAERAQELTNSLAVTFLDSVFRDGEMITPENTEIPDDLIYQVR